MNSIQLIRKLKNDEIKLGAKIGVYYCGKYISSMVYNGSELIYDEDKLNNGCLIGKYYSFKIEDNSILDKKEIEYLRKVIEPFRNKVISIYKTTNLPKSNELLMIVTKVGIDNSFSTPLPYFEPNTMYKGMEINRSYSLKELEL